MVSFRNVANQRAGYHEWPVLGHEHQKQGGERENNKQENHQKNPNHHHHQEGTIKMIVCTLGVLAFFFLFRVRDRQRLGCGGCIQAIMFYTATTRNTFSPLDTQEQEALIGLRSLSSSFPR